MVMTPRKVRVISLDRYYNWIGEALPRGDYYLVDMLLDADGEKLGCKYQAGLFTEQELEDAE